MTKKKPYRKGMEYLYVVSGITSSGPYYGQGHKTCYSYGTITLNKHLTAFEMHSEVLWHVRNNQEIGEDATFAVTFYHVEPNMT